MDVGLLFAMIIINAFVLLVEHLLQESDINSKTIPPKFRNVNSPETQPKGTPIQRIRTENFLFREDFAINTWGMLIFFPLIGYSFKSFLRFDGDWVLFFATAFLFFIIKVQNDRDLKHSPSWAFPGKGKMLLSGFIHTLYLSVNTGMAVVCLVKVITYFTTDAVCEAEIIVFSIVGPLGCLIISAADNNSHHSKINKTSSRSKNKNSADRVHVTPRPLF